MPAEKQTTARSVASEWPTELVAKAKYELHVFDRVAAETGVELVAEVERLREIISRAKQESELIQYQGRSVIAVPYWFLRSA